jgi:hypothetical protein
MRMNNEHAVLDSTDSPRHVRDRSWQRASPRSYN